jgi:hypothetical protein
MTSTPRSRTARSSSNYPIPNRSDWPFALYGSDRLLLFDDQRLCAFVERLAARDGSGGNRSVFHGMPWLTPILGSGCLEIGEGPAIDLSEIAQSVRDALLEKGVTDYPERQLGDPGMLAHSYADALYKERSHDQPADGSGASVPSRRAALLTLTAALLSRFFSGGRMSLPTPTSRSWAGEKAVADGNSLQDILLREVVVPTTVQLLEVAASDLPPVRETIVDAKRRFYRGVAGRLSAAVPTLFLGDLCLMTELTWLEMSLDTLVYPGWSDLMMQLMLSTTGPHNLPAGRRPRVLDLNRIVATVVSLLEGPTQRSWEARKSSAGRERSAFYSSVARLLHAQAETFGLLHRLAPADVLGDPDLLTAEQKSEWDLLLTQYKRANGLRRRIDEDRDLKWDDDGPQPRSGSVELPLPVAIVTSFDIELEIALWEAGTPFHVVTPFFAQTVGRRHHVDIVWLVATLDPRRSTNGDGLTAIRSGPHQWDTSHRMFKSRDKVRYPTLVRLSGCPLLTAPAYDGELKKAFVELGFRDSDHISLKHALIVDEQTALRHSENEIFFVASRAPASTSRSGDDRPYVGELPHFLSTSTASNDRVWIALGTQLDDPAIRSRLFTHLSLSSVRNNIDALEDSQSHDEGQPREESHPHEESESGSARRSESRRESHHARSRPSWATGGLAINKRLELDEVVALHWLGFEFASETDCGEFGVDIAHCALHLERITEKLRQMPERPEELDVPVDWERADPTGCELWQGGFRV